MSSGSYESSAEALDVMNHSDVCLETTFADVDTLSMFVTAADYTFCILSFMSSALQIYVIRQASQNIRRGNGDQCLHVFLLSMTIGDLMLTGVCYPLEFIPRVISMYFNKFKMPRLVNIAMHFLTWVALSGSSVSLILLNLEKLIYFKYPLRYTSFVTRHRGVVITVFMWSGCFLFVSACWYFECFVCRDFDCSSLGILADKKMMYLVFSMSVCVAPTVTSLTVAIYILKVVGSHRKRLAEEQALYSHGQPSPSHAITARLRTFYFIFMTTVFTALTLLPYRLYHLKVNFFNSQIAFAQKNTCLSLLGQWGMLYLVASNAILNPLITVTVLPQYRLRFFSRLIGGSSCGTEHKAAEV